jgi:diguanylate cyclase (GGDEF)-like protein
MEDSKRFFTALALVLMLFSSFLLLFPLAGELLPSLFWPGSPKQAEALLAGEGLVEAPGGVSGLLDLRGMGGSAFPLDGGWLFYSGKTLSPEEEIFDGESTELRDTAGLEDSEWESSGWEELELPAEISGFAGRGTLALRLLLPPGEKLYGLKIPYFGSAWRLFIDGKEVGRSGEIDPYTPRYVPREIFFSAEGGETDLLFHIANEHHRRVRLTRLYFGPEEKIRELSTRRLIKDSILFGSLLLLALYHLLLFIAWNRETAFLHLGIIAILTALRVGFLNERILVQIWPTMPGELMMKAGFLPAFLLLPFLVYYLLRLTGIREPVPVARGLRAVTFIFLILVIFFPLKVYDAVFTFTIIPIAMLGLFGVIFISFRYRLDSRVGAILLFIGGLAIFLAAVNDYLREVSVIRTGEMVSSGILFFLLLQSFFLSWHLKRSQDEQGRLAGEVDQLNQELEMRIQKRTGELEEANQQLETLSRIDGLTGIPNRRYFDEVLANEWKRGEREGHPLSLIMADVDFFKDYNDNYGHPAGDECLKQIAAILQENLLRGEDFVARYGGEEFVILLPGHSTEEAVQVAEKLRSRIEAAAILHEYSSTAPVVTISLGAAGLAFLGDYTMEDLLRRADQALYTAKRIGKNRVEGFTP